MCVAHVRWCRKNKHEPVGEQFGGAGKLQTPTAVPEKNRAPVPGTPGLQQSQFATLK